MYFANIYNIYFKLVGNPIIYSWTLSIFFKARQTLVSYLSLLWIFVKFGFMWLISSSVFQLPCINSLCLIAPKSTKKKCNIPSEHNNNNNVTWPFDISIANLLYGRPKINKTCVSKQQSHHKTFHHKKTIEVKNRK